jgi:hypothetical protein
MGFPRPPHTVVAFAAFAGTNVLIALVHEGPNQRLVGGALVLTLATYGLVRGWWLAWAFLTAVTAGNMVIGVLEWPALAATWIVLVNGIMLALLFNWPTWRHAQRGRPRLPARLG